MKQLKTGHHGFTLIELLIVLSCFLVINLIVIALFKMGATGEGTRGQSFRIIGQQRTAMNLIAKDIREADGIEKQFHNIDFSPNKLILKMSNGDRIIYAKDTSHSEIFKRITIDSKGQAIPMTVMTNLNDITFRTDTNTVFVYITTGETGPGLSFSRGHQMVVKLRKSQE